ncbi:MAG: 1-deoxy-D-xylulose-5-phosphate reductoisomerase, partial [Porphyromonadaceae bacterium]|nr:1-deoxy-D-xylulose-5-phosphate reductoisomerase [Porphyromonadaceae bacterium]
MIQKKRIAILGSTGSIGTQALEVVRSHREAFEVTVLVARRSTELLIAQALEFSPAVVVISGEAYYPEVRQALSHTSIEVMAGSEAIAEAVVRPDVDIVLTAMVGFSGLVPTLAAITAGKTIALSNKETLVVAGELIMSLAARYEARILPVDSEHSAIYQCLVGEEGNPLERILLTASGGPFRSYKRVEELEAVTVEAALRHPNWSMGAKVTIDSASLMNKGLEMIEARWLFDTPAESIEVLVHPQSIIHSMVEFADGSIKAQLGQPDMRLPISYALGLTERVSNDYPRLNFLEQT